MILLGVGTSDGGKASDLVSVFGESILDEQQLLVLLSLGSLGLEVPVEGCVVGDAGSVFPPPQHELIFGFVFSSKPVAIPGGIDIE